MGFKAWERSGPRYTDKRLLADLTRKIAELGRLPKDREVDSDRRMASSSLYKQRFESMSAAFLIVGNRVPKRPKDQHLIRELQRVRRLLGFWPSRSDIQRLRKAKKTRWGNKVYETIFGSVDEGVHSAGGPAPLSFDCEALIEELYRLRDLDLPDKPAGESPSYKHVAGKRCPYSVSPFIRCFGRTADEWAIAAGLPPRPLRDRDPRRRVLIDYRKLYEQLGRLPLTSDLKDAGIDPTPIYRYFGGLPRLRIALGLPPETTGTIFRGDDGFFYQSAEEGVFANTLLKLLIAGTLLDYEPKVRFALDRQWEVDFLVTLSPETEFYVEYDGLGLSRGDANYSRLTDRMKALRGTDLPLWIVSPHTYRPAHGALMSPLEFEQRVAAYVGGLHASLATIPSHSGDHQLSTKLDVHVAHVSWLRRRGVLPEGMGASDGANIVREFLAPIEREEDLVPIPALAAELEVSPGVLHRAVACDELVPEVFAGRGRQYPLFRLSQTARYRRSLGETLTSTVGLLSQAAFAVRAQVTESEVRHLVGAGKLEVAGKKRVRGRLVRFFAPESVKPIRSAHGHKILKDHAKLLTSSQLADASNVGRSTINRLVDAGKLDYERGRLPYESGPKKRMFAPELVDRVKQLAGTAEMPPHTGTAQPLDALVGVPEAARTLGVNRTTVNYWLRHSKVIPALWVRGPRGWTARFTQDQVNAMRRLPFRRT